MIMEAQLKKSYFSEDLGSVSYVNTIYQHMSRAEAFAKEWRWSLFTYLGIRKNR